MTLAIAPADSDRARLMLRETKDLLDPEIRLAVAQLAAPTRRVTDYHLGWTDRDGTPAGRPPGKGLRGVLVLASARAAGGLAECALQPAVAIELVHNFSVVHDDVMDQDAMRRGVPTAWAVFGEAEAILAGDAMLALAFAVLADARTRHKATAYARELCRAMLELVAGQSADLAFEDQRSVSAADCLAMASGKTGSLIAAACAMGAIAADAADPEVAALRMFGRHLGIAFQIADDLLGLGGDPGTTGKPVGADIRRRKKTLPVVAALADHGHATRRLADLYGSSQPMSPADVDEATDLIERTGGIRAAHEEMRRQKERAAGCLLSARLAPDGTNDLLAVLELSINRSH